MGVIIRYLHRGDGVRRCEWGHYKVRPVGLLSLGSEETLSLTYKSQWL